MTYALNPTHDPSLDSWLDAANVPGTDFPIQNLPFALFRKHGGADTFRGGVAIGDQIVDLRKLAGAGVLSGVAQAAAQACTAPTLNAFMAMGSIAWSTLRRALSDLLRTGSPRESVVRGCLVPQSKVEYAVPAHIGDYTDFYTSVHHATAIGRLLRPDNPLLPNYKWVPIGYHGRASSIGVSGQSFARPVGQMMPLGADKPIFGPSRRLDYELEVGIFIGAGNAPGTRIPVADAESHVFGLCLLNDWSARDIQSWEYQPLGPFLAKNFATTISPWIVTLEALAPYRMPWTRPADDPAPLAYLDAEGVRASGAFDVQLEVLIETEKMRAARSGAVGLSRSSFRHSYWTVAQLVAHHTVNGCNLMPGDLLGSGTQSGPDPCEAGSLVELTGGGKKALDVGGEPRTFLEDGDTVILRGWCERAGAARVGFGECRGTVLPAVPL